MSMFARLAAATLLATAASPVAALSIQFVLTGPHSASFLVPQNPAPAVTNVGSYFDLKVSGIFDNIAGLRTLRFYNNSLQGGFEVIGLFSTRYTQLYLGSEAAPTFYTGDYQLLDRTTGQTYALIAFPTADAVPEPAAWVLLITGFALTGVAMRRRVTGRMVPGRVAS